MGLGSDSVLDAIVHPDRLRSLRRFFVTPVVVQRPTVTPAANGEQVTTWATVIATQGNMAPRPMMERRGTDKTTVPGGWSLNLKGHYPTILKTDRVLVDGVAYNIADVVHDSLGQSTRLDLERTTH